MRWLIALSFAALALSPALAAAADERLSLSEARRLLSLGDHDALSSAFHAHHAAFQRGEMSEPYYFAPFFAFLVHDERHVATIGSWLTARPDDPAALTAHAALADKEASTFAEFRQPQAMSSDIAHRYTTLARVAIQRYALIMERHPAWIFGPFRVQTAHAPATAPEMRGLVHETLEAHGSPMSHLRGDLLSIPQDVQDPRGRVLQICEAGSPNVRGLSFEECLAFGLAAHSRSMLEHARLTAVLEADEEGHFLLHLSYMLMRPGGEERLIAHLTKYDLPWPSWSLYMAREENAGMVLPFVRAALDYDQGAPLLWASLAMHLARAGETDGIDEALDRANALAPRSAYVTRSTWAVIETMQADHRVLPFAERVRRQFSNDFQAWYEPVVRMLRAPETTSLDRSGRMHSDNACRRKRIFEAAKRTCAGESRNAPACSWVFSGRVDEGIAALDAPRCDGVSGEATFRRPGEVGNRNAERAPRTRPAREPAPHIEH